MESVEIFEISLFIATSFSKKTHKKQETSIIVHWYKQEYDNDNLRIFFQHSWKLLQVLLKPHIKVMLGLQKIQTPFAHCITFKARNTPVFIKQFTSSIGRNSLHLLYFQGVKTRVRAHEFRVINRWDWSLFRTQPLS